MSGLTTSDLYALKEKHFNRTEDIDVAVGLRPSGVVHLGNMSVLALAGILSREIGPHISRVNTTVCDIDFPDVKEWNPSQQGYVRYFKSLPDRHGCHPNMLEHSLDSIRYFTSGIEAITGVKYFVQLLSDVQRQEEFRHSLRKVVETPKFMEWLLPHIPKDRVLVYPICPNCSTSDCQPSLYRGGTLITRCTNPDCSTEDYDMKINDCSQDLSVHFFIDPMRDRIVSPKSRIHVFGGDYNEVHGGNAPKIDKIVKVMRTASKDIPDILMGPMYYSKDGSKMSKTKDNGLTMDVLREHFGLDYERRVLDLAEHIAQKGYKNVDYRIVEDFLFSQSR